MTARAPAPLSAAEQVALLRLAGAGQARTVELRCGNAGASRLVAFGLARPRLGVPLLEVTPLGQVVAQGLTVDRPLTTLGLTSGMHVRDQSEHGRPEHVVAGVTHPAPGAYDVAFTDGAHPVVGARHTWTAVAT